jgi:hypothetical protein
MKQSSRDYGREYTARRYTEFRKQKDQISQEVFGGRCGLCGSTENSGHYHLHHLEYDPEQSAYKRNSKAQWTRTLRLREAQNHPERFELLCQSCHRLVTTLGGYIIRRLKIATGKAEHKPNLEQLFDLLYLEAVNRKNP